MLANMLIKVKGLKNHLVEKHFYNIFRERF